MKIKKPILKKSRGIVEERFQISKLLMGVGVGVAVICGSRLRHLSSAVLVQKVIFGSRFQGF